jgi:hypothetical protein
LSDTIGVDVDTAHHGANSAEQVSGELPSPHAIGQIDGNRSEPAASSFTAFLEMRSDDIADRVERIRAFVAGNAAALRNAVETLRETDRMNAESADQAESMIDAVATMPSAGSSSSSANQPVPAAGSDAAAQAKEAFGG